MNRLGVVVIGRNEGERLVRCLASIGRDQEVVYVDSGSADASIDNAERAGAMGVPLNMSIPFTAARARNAGRALLSSGVCFVQFVDGDCIVQPGWLQSGCDALLANPDVAAVFGTLRELKPEASIYNWLCDIEWKASTGNARYFGGNAMLRTSALDAVGGYSEGMIAGEEPDLAIRLRADGWQILCIPQEMALHDAAIHRFTQWWRRAERSGHAYAELAARHRGSRLQDYTRRLHGVYFWASLPMVGAITLVAAIVLPLRAAAIPGLLLMTCPLAQLMRLIVREGRRRRPLEALRLATFLMLAKPAQALGAVRYAIARARRQRLNLIEYKDALE